MSCVGINISHHGSVCLKEKDNIKYYEEDRFNKDKYFEPTKDNFDYKCLNKIDLKNKDFIFSSYGTTDDSEKIIIDKLKNKYEIKNIFYDYYSHHLYHVICGFYFSNVLEALCIVIDGGGARHPNQIFTYQEMDSIYYITKDSIQPLYKHYSNIRYNLNDFNYTWNTFNDPNKNEVIIQDKGTEYAFTQRANPAYLFNIISNKIGFRNQGHDAGKVMGLAAYGKNTGNTNEDLAYQLQLKTEKYTSQLIKKSLSYINTNNIIISGGYALNCSNNYKYAQKFKNINFFIDPVAHDGGTAIGAAVWYDNYR
jgi:carbamoyltransferase